MQYKRFRSQQFYVGDLVEPNWHPKEPMGTGMIIDIKDVGHRTEPFIVVSWQLRGITNEHPMDINVISQTLD
jgi:hypothetical protein